MKILFFNANRDEEAYWTKNLREKDVKFYEENIPSSNLNQEDYKAEIICIRNRMGDLIDAETLDKFKNLKLIVTRTTGFDHIDMDECKKRGIQVSNIPSYGENTVAEHTFSLILSLSRNVHKSYLRSQRDDFSIQGLCGFDLREKTIGVVGVGQIGKHVVKIAKGFGMNVIAFDNNQDNILAEVLNFKYVQDLNELLEKSDIVTLHLPYGKSTHHLINKENFSRMKKGAILINTARGGLVDTDALYEALQSGKLSGAGLDVIEGEEVISEEKELLFSSKNVEKLRNLFKSKAIFKMDNVVFTPHNAFNSKEAIERIMNTTTQNIESFLDGKPINIIA
jgi:D-lactate dehydrogenase